MGRDFLILGYPQVQAQGCPDHMALNADLTSDYTFLLNDTLKEVCVTPIQLACYLFFFLTRNFILAPKKIWFTIHNAFFSPEDIWQMNTLNFEKSQQQDF